MTIITGGMITQCTIGRISLGTLRDSSLFYDSRLIGYIPFNGSGANIKDPTKPFIGEQSFLPGGHFNDGYVEPPTSCSGGTFAGNTGTWSFWVNVTGLDEGYLLFDNTFSNSIERKIYMIGSSLGMRVVVSNWQDDGPTSSTPFSSITEDFNTTSIRESWHHVAYTYAPGVAGEHKIYVDAVLQHTWTPGVDVYDQIYSGYPGLVQGFGDSGTGGGPLVCFIDDVGIFNGILSLEEVQQIYNGL
jgi:hypothetical protein